MSLPVKVIKRNYDEVDYTRDRITIAISKALTAVMKEIESVPTFIEFVKLDQSGSVKSLDIDEKANYVTDLVEQDLIKLNLSTVNIEQIQELVERNLMKAKLFSTAKAYILYRDQHNKEREKPIDKELQRLTDESMKTFDNNIARMFTYLRTYSRWIEEKGRRETWVETVDRYMDFMKEKIQDKLTEEEYDEVRSYILHQKVMPSMRLLQFAGPAARRCNVCAYNCAYTVPSKIKHLKHLMYISLCGTGLGFSVEYDQRYPLFNEDGTPLLDKDGNEVIKVIPIVDNFPVVQPPSGNTFKFEIEDSKEGWCDAFGFGLEKWFNGDKVKFDYSKIRPKNAPMKTMGGKASGPEALKKFLSFVKSVIRRRAGYKVLSVDIHDIICRMAIDTSEGGLRRAALISLSELNDEEMRIAKIGRSLFSNQQRFKSNNSVVYTRKPTREQLDKEWKSLVDSKNGERGIFNRGDLHKVLPQRRIDVIGDLIHRMGTNPCVTADTWVQTVEGPRQVSDLIGKKVNVIVNGQAYPMISEGFFFTGNKLTYQIKTNKGYIIKLTENHQLLKNVNINKKIKQEWIEAKYLKIGDEICLSNHRISNHFSIQNTPIFSFVNENQNDELFDIINVKHDNYISYHQLTKEYKCNEWNGPGTFEEGWLIGEIIGDGGIIKESSETKNHSAYLRFWGDSSEHMKNIAVILTKKYVETRSDFSGTYNIANNTWNVRCIGLYQLCKKYGITKDKMFTSLTEKTSSDFQRGLIRGFFDADGSPQGNLNKGYSVRLSQSNITRLEVIQRMLYRLGIISSLCQNRKESGMRLLPDGHGGKKEYFCEADNELIISKDNIGMYHKFINFFEPAKVNRMNNMMNSYTRTPYKEKFIDQIESIILIGYESVYDVTIQDVHEFCANGIRSHNCGEILLLLMQFCNLSEVICRFNDTLQDLLNKIRISAIIGTYQSMLTDFKYIDKKWKEHQELERLLGVSLTGIYDCPLFFTEESYKNRTFVGNGEIFKQLKECAIETNKIYAKRFGINQSTAVTTGKPSGTVSQVTDTSNGGHPRFAPYYIRRIRIAANDPLFQLMKAEGYTYAPEVGQKEETATVFVIDFPTKAPEGSIFVKDVTSIQQLEFWKVIKTQYTEHNPSVSIYYREHETDQIKEWIRDNWEYITGLSFFPLDENVYELAVYEEITEAQYYELISKIKKVNFAKLIHYEKSDTTDVVKEVACAGGKCEI